jgi:FixJ family two-component response regulator
MSSKPLIYAVDDDVSMNQIMEARFTKFGCEVETFTDAKAVLDAVRVRRPHLLVLDLDLGAGLSGFDLIDALRNGMHFTFPIIVVSAETSSAKVAHALEIGATDYVVKPPFRFKFEEKVAEYIEAERLAIHTPIALRKIREDAQPVKIDLPISIREVNPMGFTLLTPHLIRKGTLFTLSGETIRQVIPSKEQILVTVLGSATRATNEGRLYEIRVEIDAGDAQSIQEIRAFLGKAKAANP